MGGQSQKEKKYIWKQGSERKEEKMLVLKVEEEAMRLGMQVSSRS